MKVSVCLSKTFYYEVEIPEWFAERDEDGELLHEALLVESCYEADPTDLVGVDEYDSSINSICLNGDALYYGD